MFSIQTCFISYHHISKTCNTIHLDNTDITGSSMIYCNIKSVVAVSESHVSGICLKYMLYETIYYLNEEQVTLFYDEEFGFCKRYYPFLM